jgi:hypothetical protein
MADTTARAERAIKELTGNESLLDMLDTEAAAGLLEWGMTTTRAVVNATGDLDEGAAEAANAPRLKLVRQSLRSIGNWAAGNYTDPGDRLQLRERLLENFRLIHGEEMILPSAAEVDRFLNLVDGHQHSPRELISGLRALFEGLG